MAATKRILAKKQDPPSGVCILIDNGEPCNEPIAWRGVCKRHHAHLKRQGVLEKYALPKQGSKENVYELKEELVAGVCRVIVNGVACDEASERRGLCLSHYHAIWRRPDVDLDDFAISVKKSVYRKKAKPKQGICMIIENDIHCLRPVQSRGLCKHHRRKLAKTAEGLDYWALPPKRPPVNRESIITKKRKPRPGLCILVEGGKSCANPAGTLGVCDRHYGYLRRNNLLGKYELEPKDRRNSYELKDNPEPDICRVNVNGKPCTEPARRRGLCVRHYQQIWEREDLNLDDFAIVTGENTYGKKGRREEDICLIVENGAGCQKPAHARGLCKRHYRALSESDEGIDYWGLPSEREHTFSLNQNPEDGVCILIDNGESCTGSILNRGFCRRHYEILKNRHSDIFEKWALPIRKAAHCFEKQAPSQLRDGVCSVIDNDVPCTSRATRSGICPSHRSIISSSDEYRVDDFIVDSEDSEYGVKSFIEDGVCIVIENGIPCSNPMDARGFCASHGPRLKKAGIFDDFALPVGKMSSMKKLPHLYLDKNLLFDYFAYKCCNRITEIHAVAIVESVLRREFRATISASCITSLYNHARHLLGRDTSDGGFGYDVERAEDEARGFMNELLFSRQYIWRVVYPTEDAFVGCIRNRRFEQLSVEDALEFDSFVTARAKPGGPTIFVSSDHHFEELESVHPAHVVETYRSRISKMPRRK